MMQEGWGGSCGLCFGEIPILVLHLPLSLFIVIPPPNLPLPSPPNKGATLLIPSPSPQGCERTYISNFPMSPPPNTQQNLPLSPFPIHSNSFPTPISTLPPYLYPRQSPDTPCSNLCKVCGIGVGTAPTTDNSRPFPTCPDAYCMISHTPKPTRPLQCKTEREGRERASLLCRMKDVGSGVGAFEQADKVRKAHHHRGGLLAKLISAGLLLTHLFSSNGDVCTHLMK